MLRKSRHILLSCAGLWTLSSVAVSAQTVASAEAETGRAPKGQSATPASNIDQDAIIVTARRRDENIEKVPISIVAIGAQQLRDRSIFSESDLQTSVPGLTVRQNGNANQFNYAIRGQSVDTYSNSPPGVLSYIDDVQVISHSATTFYDLQNIQVLKGPQGTLFGRNSTGGAVLFQTAQPDETLGGYIDARYGSFDARHIEGAVSLPGSDAVALRIAGSYTGGGGAFHNLATGRDLGNQNVKSIRATLLLKPAPGIRNTTVVQYTHEGGTNTPTELFSVNGCGQTFNGAALTSTVGCLYVPGSAAFDAYLKAHPGLYSGGVVAYPSRQHALGLYTVDLDYPDFHRARSVFAINTTTYELSHTLTLKNILGYNNSKSVDGFDYDGTPYPIFSTGGVPKADGIGYSDTEGFLQHTKQFSEEFQLQGKAFEDRLVYVIGAYYLHETDRTQSPLYAYGFSPVAPGVSLAYDARNGDESIAGFAQATYKITSRLNLTGGFRYTGDTVSELELPRSLFAGAPKESSRYSKPSWTVSLDYQVTPGLLAYATTRGSWRAGGYNYSITPINTTAAGGGNAFRPETTEDIEAGIKYSGRDLGVPVTFNADIFNQWIHNVQRAAYVVGPEGTGTLFTANVPEAKITGVEFEMSVRPLAWMQLGGSGVFTNARYSDGRVNLLGSPTLYGPYADTPRYTGTVFAEISHRLIGGAGTIILRGDIYGQSKMHFSNVGATIAPNTTIAGYGVANVRLSWSEVAGSRVTAAVFVRNLANKAYYTGGNADGPASGFNTVTIGQRRMIGGEVRLAF